MRSVRGFAWVEALFVLVILGLLAAVAIPRLARCAFDPRQDVCDAAAARINERIEAWAEAHDGTYPAGQVAFEAHILESGPLFEAAAPSCPCGEPYVYDPATHRVRPHRH